MAPLLFGTCVLHATRQISPLIVPSLFGIERRIGNHVNGRYNGTWSEASDNEPHEVYLPQRYKHLSITTTNIGTLESLAGDLSVLDSKYEGARQIYKLSQLIRCQIEPFAAVVNIAKTATEEKLTASGSFYLLSLGVPLYFALVFDTEEDSVQLVWSTLDFKKEIQDNRLIRYVFFPLPTVLNRPVFIDAQNICARWWRLTRSFGESKQGILKACNALELILYKDPDIKTYAE